MHKDEVSALLGSPDDRGLSGSHVVARRAVEEWDYYLGMNSGFGIDEDILVVEFSAEGVVVRYALMNT